MATIRVSFFFNAMSPEGEGRQLFFWPRKTCVLQHKQQSICSTALLSFACNSQTSFQGPSLTTDGGEVDAAAASACTRCMFLRPHASAFLVGSWWPIPLYSLACAQDCVLCGCRGELRRLWLSELRRLWLSEHKLWRGTRRWCRFFSCNTLQISQLLAEAFVFCHEFVVFHLDVATLFFNLR